MMNKLNIKRFAVAGSSSATVATLGGVSSACEFYAEVVLNSQSTSGNTSNITVNFKATSLKTSCGYGSLGSPIAYFSVDGSEKSRISVKDFKAKTTISLGSWTGNISHSSDGKKTISVSATYDPVKGNTGYYQYAPKKTTLTFNVTLTTIPRYFSSTPVITVSSVTEKSAVINWTTPENCSQTQYKIDSGSWVTVESNINKKSGSMTVPLSANKTYTIYTDFKRYDSGLWAQTKPSKSVTTYDYPKITAITVNHSGYALVGEDYKFTVYNPLGREFNFKLYGVAENKLLKEFNSKEKSTLSGFNDATTVSNMYSSLINNSSSTFKVVTKYDNVERTFTSGNTVYKVDSNVVSPTFNDFNWEVVDDYTKNLTGTNNIVIPDKSRIKVTITPSQNAVPKNSANAKSYSVMNKEFSGSWKYPNSENTVLDDAANVPTTDTIRVTAIDSRGISTICDKKVNIIKPVIKPVITKFSIDRLNGIDEQLFLNLEFKIWNGYFDLNNTRKNKINKIRYTMNPDSDNPSWVELDLNTFLQYASSRVEDNYIVYKLTDEDSNKRISCGTLPTAESCKTKVEIYQGYSTYNLGSEYKNYTIPSGKIGMSRYKDEDGNHHYGFGGLANQEYVANFIGDINVDGNVSYKSVVIRETNTDLNDFKDKGVYVFYSDYTPANIPIGVNGYLIVLNTNTHTYVKQIWLRMGTNGTNDWNTYVRTYNADAGNWSRWSRFINTDGNGNTPIAGQLLLSSNGFRTSHEAGFRTDEYGNFYHTTDTSTGYWNLRKQDGTVTHKFYWETGDAEHTGTLNVGHSLRIPKNATAGFGLCNSDGTSIICDHNNTNVTVRATGGTLYLGYRTTTGLDLMDGKATVNSSGDINTQGNLYSIKSSGEPDVALARSDYSNSCRIYAAGSNAGDMAFGVAATKGITNAGAKMDLTPTDLEPRTNGGLTLGTGSYRWGQIYSTKSSISTSDRTLKENIEEFDERYNKLFDELKPVKYKFKDTEGEIHDRIHSGFVSQDVEEAMYKSGLTDKDFAGFCKDHKMHSEIKYDDEGNEIEFEKVYDYDENGEPIYEYALRYEQFIALNTWQIQKLKKENEELRNTIEDLTARITKLEGGK